MNRFIQYAGAVVTVLILAFASCKDDDNDKEKLQETGTVTDIDNNTYRTVKIGNSWWMAEDLQVKHYRNGMSVTLSDDDSTGWVNDSIGLCCTAEDDIQNKIGIFYNWNAVHNTNGLAPAGWHIPSDDEWKELEQSLGMNAAEASASGWRGSDEGDQLKVAGPSGWTTYGSVWGTNKSGFSAEAKGCRMFYAGWAQPKIGAAGFWWTASEYSGDAAYYRYLDKKNSNIYRSSGEKTYGFAVRCVKD
jgi:uncharacterized protein (TIGR02145 family)